MERAHASPRDEAARDRLAYDEIFHEPGAR